MRVKTKWNAKNRVQTPEDMGGVIAFNIWKIAGEVLLHLENEDFEIETHNQRLDVMEELLAFFVHVSDRMVYEKLDQDRRAAVITALAKRTADLVQQNRMDFNAKGDFGKNFIDLLNQRMTDYAEYPAETDGPGFAMIRSMGSRVGAVMGDRHRKWVGDQMLDIEIPDAMVTLRKVIKPILDRE